MNVAASWLSSLGRSESTVRRQKQRKDYVAYYLPILGVSLSRVLQLGVSANPSQSDTVAAQL